MRVCLTNAREFNIMGNETSLAIMTRASQMLVEATTVQRAKELKDLALTAKDWATRKKKGDEVIENCRYYALMAERKMGEMLKATKRAKGQLKHAVLTGDHDKENSPTLADLGVSKNESSHAQKLAALPEAQFQEVVSGAKTMAQVKKAGKAKKTATAKTDIGGPPPDPNAKAKDKNGKIIPAKLLPLWRRRQEIQDICTQLSKIKMTSKRAEETKDLLWAQCNHQQVQAEIERAYTAIKSTMPHAVCPYCQGEGCRACKNRGFLGDFSYHMAPKELKK